MDGLYYTQSHSEINLFSSLQGDQINPELFREVDGGANAEVASGY